jgi:nitroreductase/NAD-dependent dihydropyrimidine dehydrogenase PreA subunit
LRNEQVVEMVSIDKELCTGCGLCIDICPYKAIQLVGGKAEYMLKGDCFSCGHCQAVCPVDAVSMGGLVLDFNFSTFTELPGVVQPGTGKISELVSLMRSRRSCRKYQVKTVSLNLLEDLVKIGTTAPSGTNSQSWRFIILPERDDVLMLGDLTADYYRNLNRQARNGILRFIVKLSAGDSLGRYYRRYHDSVAKALREWDEEGRDRLFHGAVAAILVTGRKDASCPAEDALLATQNILLAAHVMGLGSCLIGFVVEAMRRNSGMKNKMGLDAGEEIYSVIALGYPDIKYQRPANRKPVMAKILSL